jgi:hypothetical protein
MIRRVTAKCGFLVSLACILVLVRLSADVATAQAKSVGRTPPAYPVMTRPLQVQSVALQGAARPGSLGMACVCVVVQSSNGLVAGLTLNNFKVDARRFGATGFRALVPRTVWHLGKGAYNIYVTPTGGPGTSWRAGEYVISVTVTVGALEGGSVTTVTIK